MSTNTTEPVAADPEDMFSDSRMSIGDHIEDLRSHLFRALKGLLVGMLFSFWPLGPIVLDILIAPVAHELTQFELRKFDRAVEKKKASMDGVPVSSNVSKKWINRGQLAEALGLDLDKLPKSVPTDLPTELKGKGDFVQLDMAAVDEFKDITEAERKIIEMRNKSATSYSITEMFMVYMKVSFFTGLVLSSPWVFYHIWMFIAAGLYPNEKKLVNWYLPFSLLLFIAGVCLCEFFAMGQAVRAMLWFNEWLDVDAEIRLNEWLSFAIMMPVVFGLAFQTPLVMTFLHRVGIVTTQNFRQYRRIAWFALVILAALLAPAPDAYSLLLLWVPMVALYEFGILLCVWQGDQAKLLDWGEEDETKSGEMVEV